LAVGSPQSTVGSKILDFGSKKKGQFMNCPFFAALQMPLSVGHPYSTDC
jgi:hypothetical protein